MKYKMICDTCNKTLNESKDKRLIRILPKDIVLEHDRHNIRIVEVMEL